MDSKNSNKEKDNIGNLFETSERVFKADDTFPPEFFEELSKSKSGNAESSNNTFKDDEEKSTPSNDKPVKDKEANADIKDENIDENDELYKQLSGLQNVNKNIRNLQDIHEKIDDVETKSDLKALQKELKKLADEGKILLYEDKPNIEDYNVDELKALIEENIVAVREEAVVDFMDALPEPIQLAVKCAMEDNKNLSSVLRMVADAMEGKNIVENLGEKDVIRAVLKNKGMEDEEIETLINSYDRKGILKQKYEESKKEFETLLTKDLDDEIKKAQSEKKKAEEMYKQYIEGISKTVEQLDADKKIKKNIIDGLTKADYELANGVKTNKLYYLLNKYQFEEPKYDLISEALWLLEDPESYKQYVREKVKKEVIEENIKPKLRRSNAGIESSSPEIPNNGLPLERKKDEGRRLTNKRFNFDI